MNKKRIKALILTLMVTVGISVAAPVKTVKAVGYNAIAAETKYEPGLPDQIQLDYMLKVSKKVNKDMINDYNLIIPSSIPH
ncbi:hypothetical protein, partial [Clostridium botulinum]|uniref:hypothetical protein n=1 Tax=Clostridium botulinum TaxID=1491 RepID=UPI0004CFFE18